MIVTLDNKQSFERKYSLSSEVLALFNTPPKKRNSYYKNALHQLALLRMPHKQCNDYLQNVLGEEYIEQFVLGNAGMRDIFLYLADSHKMNPIKMERTFESLRGHIFNVLLRKELEQKHSVIPIGNEVAIKNSVLDALIISQGDGWGSKVVTVSPKGESLNYLQEGLYSVEAKARKRLTLDVIYQIDKSLDFFSNSKNPVKSCIYVLKDTVITHKGIEIINDTGAIIVRSSISNRDIVNKINVLQNKFDNFKEKYKNIPIICSKYFDLITYEKNNKFYKKLTSN